MIRSFLAIILILILAGCAGRTGPLPTDATADVALYEANTPELRSLRACQIAAIAGELVTYRLLWFPSDDFQRRGAAVAIDRGLAAIARIRNEAVGLWFETEMFLAAVLMVREMGGATKERVGAALSDGFQWIGLLREIRVASGQAALADAMIQDVINQVGDPPAVSDEAWQACEGRLARNRDLLVGGGVDVPTPAPADGGEGSGPDKGER